MAEFGWAYIDCSSSGGGGAGSAGGPTGSIQFHHLSNEITGSDNLVFHTASAPFELRLTGTLSVSGTINANELNINVTNKSVINLDVSGNTKFGDTQDDTHQYTGSFFISGAMYKTFKEVTGGGGTIYSASIADYYIGVSGSNSYIIRLPSASAGTAGRTLVIKDEWSSGSARAGDPITVYPAHLSSDLIDGSEQYLIEGTEMAAISLYSTGNGHWFVF
jgi:hypothetical protein